MLYHNIYKYTLIIIFQKKKTSKLLLKYKYKIFFKNFKGFANIY